jgi:hypothetical protein
MSKQWRSSPFVVVVALALGLSAWAQQATGASVTPSVRPPQPTELDGYIKNFQFVELAQAVASMKPSAERDYFEGVLANREGHVAESVALLEKAIPQIRASNPMHTALALHALADDYVKSFRYNDAIRTCKDLLDHFAGQLDKAERKSTQDDYGGALLLKDVPPQTISFEGPVDLATHRNPVLDTIDTDLTVGGVTASWLLDTGANFSTVSASFAQRLGVPLMKGTAQTQGITGAENKMHVAVLPELKLGGATVRNVVLLVLEDSSLNVPSGEKSRYQIQAILGYPVLQALGRITFAKDGHFLASPGEPAPPRGARLYMNLLMPLLQCKVEGRDVVFSFDSGANTSFFSARYGREFASQLRGLPDKPYGMGGAGGIRKMLVPYLPQATLGIGSTTAKLTHVPVLPELGTDGDKLFGNLGRDLTDPYRSFTIDFVNMRFELGEKIPEKAPGK